MATFRDILLQVTGDASDAERVLAGVGAQLDALGAKTVRVHVELTGLDALKAEAAEAEAVLTALSKREVSIPVKLDRQTIANEIRRVGADASGTLSRGGRGGGGTSIGRDAEELGSDATRALGEGAQQTQQFVQSVDRGRSGVVGFGFSLSGLTSALMGVGIAILATAAPAIAALAASLAGAALAAGGMAVALAAVLGPAVLLAVGAFQGLSKVIAAVQARRQARDLAQTAQGHQQAANAAIQHQRAVTQLALATRDAGREIRNSAHDNEIAQRSVRDAAQSVVQTTIQAYRAWQDAIESVNDALRGLQHAELDVQRAKLDHEQAVLALRQLRKELGLTSSEFDHLFNQITDVRLDPAAVRRLVPQVDALGLDQKRALQLKQAILDVADSNLKQKDAINAVGDATRGYNRAQQDRDRYARLGIMAYGPLKSATEGLADAQWAAARSQEHYNDVLKNGISNAPSVVAARDAVRAANQQIQASSQKAATALEMVPKALRPLVDDFDRLATTFKRVMGPVLADFGQVLHGAIGGISNTLNQLAPDIDRFAARVSTSLGHLFSGLSGDRSRGFFHRMFGDAGEVFPLIERGLEHLLGFFANVAEAAQPALKSFLGYLDRIFARWDQGTKSGGGFDRMRDLFSAGEKALEHWLNLIGAVLRLIADFFGATSGQSDGMLSSLTKTVNKWDEWVNDKANASKIHDAVQKARDLLGDVARVLGNIVALFIAATPIATSFISAVVALLGPWVKLFRDIFRIIDQLPGPLKVFAGVVAGLVAVGGPIVALKLGLRLARSGVVALAESIIARLGAGSRARRVAEALFNGLGWRRQASKQAEGAVGDAASAVTANRGRIRNALSRAWRGAADAVTRAGMFLGTGGAGAMLRSLAARLASRAVGIVAVLSGVFGAESLAAAAVVSLGAVLGLALGAALMGALIGTLLRKIPAIKHIADRFAGMFSGQNDRDKASKIDSSSLDQEIAKLADIDRRIAAARARGDTATVNKLWAERKRISSAVAGSYATGGVLPGYGGGDIVHARLEPGEGILRKEVVARLGVATINALNAGYPSVSTVRGGYVNGGVVGEGLAKVIEQHFHLPPAAPAHPQPDPAAAAAQLSTYMRARGMRLS